MVRTETVTVRKYFFLDKTTNLWNNVIFYPDEPIQCTFPVISFGIFLCLGYNIPMLFLHENIF